MQKAFIPNPRKTKRKIILGDAKVGPKVCRQILPWVEVFWHNHKRYPTDTELAEEFGFDANDLLKLKVSKFYNDCLERRGISQDSETWLSDKQIAAITLITNFTDMRSIDVKLAGIGVTPELYNGWMSNPQFKSQLASRADDILENIYPEAQAQFAKQIRNGNFQALKFYYEVTGRAESPDAINIKMTMARLIEAVQKHVKDPVILQAIASEIAGVAPVAEISVKPIPSIKPSPAIPSSFREAVKQQHGDGHSEL